MSALISPTLPPVVLAPMSGVTDRPFRRVARAFGASWVVSEMVASEEFVRGLREARTRAALAEEPGPRIVQIAGCEARWMREAAVALEAEGADRIDINMGCPSKRVANRMSGSALMRDLDHALDLVTAVTGSVRVPVTLKMRLGWDHQNLNAPELASRAEAAGIVGFAVHGRTRCQFYTGRADWAAVAPTVARVRAPVLVNGDIATPGEAVAARVASGAAGVMVGRAALGRPWLLGEIAAALAGKPRPAPPAPAALAATILQQIEDACEIYGPGLALKMLRKHLAAYCDTGALRADARTALVTCEDPRRLPRLVAEAVCAEWPAAA